MNLAPIVLFVYNRPEHTRQTVWALQKNELAEKSELFVFSDGPKDNDNSRSEVFRVREYLRKIKGFKNINIVENQENLGLANSIIAGVSEIVNKYGKIIVLEDDLLTASSFLKFMNESLLFYKDIPKIFSITGYNLPSRVMKIPRSYSHDVYFNPRAHSWGWATWKNRWEKADWEVSRYKEFILNKGAIKKFNLGGSDLSRMLSLQMAGEIDSWAIRWCFTHFLEDAYSVYPIQSLVNNIGFDGSGVHCRSLGKRKYCNDLTLAKANFNFLDVIELNEKLISNFRNAFTYKEKIMRGIIRRVWQWIKNI